MCDVWEARMSPTPNAKLNVQRMLDLISNKCQYELHSFTFNCLWSSSPLSAFTAGPHVYRWLGPTSHLPRDLVRLESRYTVPKWCLIVYRTDILLCNCDCWELRHNGGDEGKGFIATVVSIISAKLCVKKNAKYKNITNLKVVIPFYS